MPECSSTSPASSLKPISPQEPAFGEINYCFVKFVILFIYIGCATSLTFGANRLHIKQCLNRLGSGGLCIEIDWGLEVLFASTGESVTVSK